MLEKQREIGAIIKSSCHRSKTDKSDAVRCFNSGGRERRPTPAGDLDGNFVQNVTTDAPAPGKAGQYNDFNEREGSKPFFYSKNELPEQKNKFGMDLTFSDRPARVQENQNATWTGELSVVVNKGDGKYQSVANIIYGFTIKDGKPNLILPIQVIDKPSEFQQKTIDDHNNNPLPVKKQ